MNMPSIQNKENKKIHLVAFFLLSIVVSFVLYILYFTVAPFIWEHNIVVPVEKLTPWFRGWNEQRDGVELYALYVLMFLNIVLTFVLGKLFSRITRTTIRYVLLGMLTLFSLLYFVRVGFSPPMASADYTHFDINNYSVLIGVYSVIFLLYSLHVFWKTLSTWLIALFLLPVIFIPFTAISWSDYSFIFSPALKILQGSSLTDIYFQYDFFLSLLAALSMRLGFDVQFFSMLGQWSYYVLIFGIFLFSRKIFIDNHLSIFLLISLVLVKIYAAPLDPVLFFQVTPLRLDWWFPLLLLLYFYGYKHWSVGLLLGFMIIFHRNFGLIYTATYAELLITLAVIDMIELRRKNFDVNHIFKHFLQQWKPVRINLAIIIAAVFLFFLFFQSSIPSSAYLYQRIGIGFMKISQQSFYWYIMALLNFSALLFFMYRRIFPTNYFIAGIFLVYLVIGNSLYFFGRSHEWNILNISASILFLFYFCLDAFQYIFYKNRFDNHFFLSKIGIIIALIFITLIVGSYQNTLKEKIHLQLQNVTQLHFLYSAQFLKSTMLDLTQRIRSVTKNDAKVYFLSADDFLYYYYGDYNIPSPITPFLAWMFNDDLIAFLNQLLEKRYYLVVDDPLLIQEALDRLSFNRSKIQDGLIFLWKE